MANLRYQPDSDWLVKSPDCHLLAQVRAQTNNYVTGVFSRIGGRNSRS